MENTMYIIVIIIAGIAVLTGIYKFWYNRIFKKKKLENNNVSWSIFIIAQFLSFGILYSGAFEEAIAHKRIIENISSSDMLTILQYAGFTLLVVSLFYIALYVVSGLIFKAISTDVIGISAEIKQNNWTSTVIVGGVLITLSLIAGSQMNELIYEFMPTIDIPGPF